MVAEFTNKSRIVEDGYAGLPVFICAPLHMKKIITTCHRHHHYHHPERSETQSETHAYVTENKTKLGPSSV